MRKNTAKTPKVTRVTTPRAPGKKNNKIPKENGKAITEGLLTVEPKCRLGEKPLQGADCGTSWVAVVGGIGPKEVEIMVKGVGGNKN